MTLPSGARCPRCDAPRAPGPECPRCGVIYAKARPRLPVPEPGEAAGDGFGAAEPFAPADAIAPGDARAVELLLRPAAVWTGDVEDARRELLVRAVAPPAALAVAFALVSSGGGHFFVRTFLSMWVHELGHAVTAWLCGYGALPGPWRTLTSATRLPLVSVAVAAGLGSLAWRGWSARRYGLAAAGAAGLAVQLVCTLLPRNAAQALVTFGGDAGAMVIGAALFATIWTDPEGPLGRGSLRWGFLAIGAAALVDPLVGWVRAWRDPGELPLGYIEGVGLSDASKLMELHGWSAGALAGRYVALGAATLVVLAAIAVTALRRARERVRDAEEAVRGARPA